MQCEVCSYFTNTHTNMSYLHTTVLILCLAQLSQMRASVIEGSDRLLSQCEGQIKLFTDSGEVRVFREAERKTNLAVNTAVLEGCGCFRLFEKKNFRGRSYQVKNMGEHKIGLRRVRSLFKTTC